MEQLQQPEHQAQPLVLLATAHSRVVGGIFAETQLAWLRISIMAVSPEWRSRGIGTTLLAEAERQAIARGCKYAYADTMEYQAPRFYLAHGFAVVGEIPDWDSHGHRKFHLSKQFIHDAPRRAKLEDMAAVAKIHRLSFFQAMPDMPVLHTPEEDLSFYSNVVFPKSEIWATEQAGMITGFIVFRPGWVDHLYVHPAHQRCGIGSRLLALALASAERLRLWTFQCNQEARRLYERHGFRIERETDGASNEERQPDVLYLWEREGEYLHEPKCPTMIAVRFARHPSPVIDRSRPCHEV